MLHSFMFGKYRRFSSSVQATLERSKSKEWIRAAPSRAAANENKPLPEPTSRNDFPARLFTSSISRRESSATAIRSSLRTLRNRRQFSPKAKRFSVSIGVEGIVALEKRLSGKSILLTITGYSDTFGARKGAAFQPAANPTHISRGSEAPPFHGRTPRHRDHIRR